MLCCARGSDMNRTRYSRQSGKETRPNNKTKQNTNYPPKQILLLVRSCAIKEGPASANKTECSPCDFCRFHSRWAGASVAPSLAWFCLSFHCTNLAEATSFPPNWPPPQMPGLQQQARLRVASARVSSLGPRPAFCGLPNPPTK